MEIEIGRLGSLFKVLLLVIGGSVGFYIRFIFGFKVSGSRREFTGILCFWCVFLVSFFSSGFFCFSFG